MCWYYHDKFSRHYGLEDFPTVVFNALPLFLILFYVYPLRFLFLWLWRGILDVDQSALYLGVSELHCLMRFPERGMMLFCSSGLVGSFGLFAAMHAYALRLAPALELDAIELCLTRGAMVGHLGSAAIGLASLALALASQPAAAGLIYMTRPLFHSLYGRRMRVRANALHASLGG